MVAGIRSALGELYRADHSSWRSSAMRLARHPQAAWLMEMLSDVLSARGEFMLGRKYATRGTGHHAAQG